MGQIEVAIAQQEPIRVTRSAGSSSCSRWFVSVFWRKRCGTLPQPTSDPALSGHATSARRVSSTNVRIRGLADGFCDDRRGLGSGGGDDRGGHAGAEGRGGVDGRLRVARRGALVPELDGEPGEKRREDLPSAADRPPD